MDVLHAAQLGPERMAAVVNNDLDAEPDRWPRFAPLARRAGVAGVLAYAMAPPDVAPDALTIYASEAGAFDQHSRLIARGFARQAAIAVFGAQTAKHS